MSTPQSWPSLRSGELIVPSGDEELLWRQVHPTQIDDGHVRSCVFAPTAKDEGELSVVRGSKVAAKDAFEYYTTQMGFESVGSYGITVDEVAQNGLRAIDDSAGPSAADLPPGHAFVDFRAVPSSSKAQKIGAKLRDLAQARGRVYP
jgi:hypothetical protein